MICERRRCGRFVMRWGFWEEGVMVWKGRCWEGGYCGGEVSVGLFLLIST